MLIFNYFFIGASWRDESTVSYIHVSEADKSAKKERRVVFVDLFLSSFPRLLYGRYRHGGQEEDRHKMVYIDRN
jgi:hypothetical protein